MRRLKYFALLGFLPLLILAGACATMSLLDPRYYERLEEQEEGVRKRRAQIAEIQAEIDRMAWELYRPAG
jgi:hypothetical protein